VAFVLAASLLGASCAGKGGSHIVAPTDPSKGAFPLWAAVGGSSTWAVIVKGQAALDVPLYKLGADWMRSMAGEWGLDYEGLSDALGFDPILDLDEALVTDAGPSYPGRKKRSRVIVLRYGKAVGNLEVVLKLAGAAASGPAIEKRSVRGRDVFFVEDHRMAIMGLDAETLAVLLGFGPEGVDSWLEGTTQPCDVREQAASDVSASIDDPHLGPPEHRLLSAWVDVEALRERIGMDEPMAEGFEVPIPLDDLRAMIVSADTMVVHASYAGSLSVLQQVRFTDAGSARAAADGILGFKARFSEGEPMPIVGGMLLKVADTLRVEAEDGTVLARWEIPEDVLRAATALVGLFVGMARAMKEQPGGPGPPPSLPFPLPRLPDAPSGPPPGI
jgi:hypothetical protein